MAVLTLRSSAVTPPFAGAFYTTKGAPLTYLEIDNNFIELDAEIHQNITRIELLELMIPVASAAAPAVATPGKLWYDTTGDEYRYWSGTQWVSISRVEYIDELIDVDTSTVPPAIGDTLSWDGANWIPSTPVLAIDELIDVDTSTNTPNDWDLLRWDSSATDVNGNIGQWIPTNVIDGSLNGGATNDF